MVHGESGGVVEGGRGTIVGEIGTFSNCKTRFDDGLGGG